MSTSENAPVLGTDLKQWASELTDYLNKQTNVDESVDPDPILLTHQMGGEKAVTPGVLMYEPTKAAPVVSNGTLWAVLATILGTPSLNYVALGSLLLQWGTETLTGPTETIVFPTSFSTANITILTNSSSHSYADTITDINFVMNGSNAATKHWLAIGEVP